MKHLLATIFILVSYYAMAQAAEKDSLQKVYSNKATLFLKNAKLESAIGNFYYSNELNPKTKMASVALHKADSLKSIVRTHLIKNLQGKWKLKSYGSNWGMNDVSVESVQEFLIFENDSVSHYKQTDDNAALVLVGREKLRFSHPPGMRSSYNEFVNANNAIWYYRITPSGELRIVHTGEESAYGRTEIVCGNAERYYARIE